MAPDRIVKQGVLLFGSAATVEALEADIEASRVVLCRTRNREFRQSFRLKTGDLPV